MYVTSTEFFLEGLYGDCHVTRSVFFGTQFEKQHKTIVNMHGGMAIQTMNLNSSFTT